MLPVPANWSFKAGATSQARAAIGSAAAAHTAKIARSPYCGIATSETGASVREGMASFVIGIECADMLVPPSLIEMGCSEAI